MLNKVRHIYRIYKKTKNLLRIERSKKALRKMYKAYQGKICFIVGNGPSLDVKDLDKLQKNRINCFGTHRIYHIFDQTGWVPTFYCAQDSELITKETSQINKMNVKYKFLAIVPWIKYKYIKDAIYIKMLSEEFYPELPKFSEDITNGIYEGWTVTYMCLQMAMYMGFNEIYLIGVDHNYGIDMNPDGTLKKDSSVKDHFSDNDVVTNIPQTYKSTLAYYAARKYAEEHGIKIYNATRGGKLEAFERVNFDDIDLKY